MQIETTPLTSALLLTTPGCAHCAALKKILQKLLSEGILTSLSIIDVAAQPDVAVRYGVKSVPWFLLGPYAFQGVYPEKDIRTWLTDLRDTAGQSRYFEYALQSGELQQVISMVHKTPEILSGLLSLATNSELDIKVRLGISAVIEEFEGCQVLTDLIKKMIQLADHPQPRVRADAAHYLSLTHHNAVIPVLKKLTVDEDREVRQIAVDALEEMEAST